MTSSTNVQYVMKYRSVNNALKSSIIPSMTFQFKVLLIRIGNLLSTMVQSKRTVIIKRLCRNSKQESMISLHRFLAMCYEKVYKPPAAYFSYPHCYCVFCEAEIVDRSTGLELKQCEHHVHRACLEDIFRTKNDCNLCNAKIFLGYEKCL